MTHRGKAVNVQVLLNGTEIKVHQAAEHREIRPGKGIHAALAGADPLTGLGEGVFIGHQQPGEIALPEILVKAAHGGQVQQTLDLGVDPGDQFVPVHIAPLPVPEDLGQTNQDLIVSQVAEEQKVR